MGIAGTVVAKEKDERDLQIRSKFDIVVCASEILSSKFHY